MKIVFCGNNERGYRCLDYISKNKDFDISLVVAHPVSGKKYPYRSVSELAKKLGLDFIAPENINSADVIEVIRKQEPDLIILAGYGQIVRREFLDIPKKKVINLHGGKLPEYRGSSPINWMIIRGERKGGISIIEVDESIDTGDILAEAPFDILESDDANSILEKTLEIFPPLLEKTLYDIMNDTVKSKKQKLSDGQYFPVRTPDDGLILWESMTSFEVFNLVRALRNPYPNAFTYYENKKLFVTDVSLYNEENVSGVPGRVILKRNDGVLVMCKDKSILVKGVKFENSLEILSAKEILSRGESFRTMRTIILGKEKI